MTPELVVLLAGRRVGLVSRNPKGRLTFTYDLAWSESRGAYPLSLTMPIAAAEHGSTAIETFIWGLLPDNEQVLERWARRFQVSAHSPFALIANVGEDCAGAVQFVRPERLDEVQGGGADRVDWLEEAEVADRLRLLREDHDPADPETVLHGDREDPEHRSYRPDDRFEAFKFPLAPQLGSGGALAWA